MNAADGLAVLYGLCDEWTARQQLIGSVGGKPDHLHDELGGADGDESAGPEPLDRQARIAQVASLARMAGG
jgi:hypothetical protein